MEKSKVRYTKKMQFQEIGAWELTVGLNQLTLIFRAATGPRS
jgi:hypothetical protein